MELCLSDHFSSYLLCPRRRIPIGVVLSKNTFQKTLAIFTKMFANLSHDVCLYPVIGHHITICKPQWLQPKEQSGALHPISSLDLSLWLLFLWSLWHIAWPGLSLGQWVCGWTLAEYPMTHKWIIGTTFVHRLISADKHQWEQFIKTRLTAVFLCFSCWSLFTIKEHAFVKLGKGTYISCNIFSWYYHQSIIKYSWDV